MNEDGKRSLCSSLTCLRGFDLRMRIFVAMFSVLTFNFLFLNATFISYFALRLPAVHVVVSAASPSSTVCAPVCLLLLVCMTDICLGLCVSSCTCSLNPYGHCGTRYIVFRTADLPPILCCRTVTFMCAYICTNLSEKMLPKRIKLSLPQSHRLVKFFCKKNKGKLNVFFEPECLTPQ